MALAVKAWNTISGTLGDRLTKLQQHVHNLFVLYQQTQSGATDNDRAACSELLRYAVLAEGVAGFVDRLLSMVVSDG